MEKYLEEGPPIIRGFHKLLTQSIHHNTPTTDNPGITWLELLLLSLAASGKHAEILGLNGANKRKSIKLTLQKFIQHARDYIGFTFDMSTAKLFNTCNIGHSRLEAFGH
eukprot:12413501-Karenia_brevis.AAC.1